MSGGSYDYAYGRIQDLAGQVAQRGHACSDPKQKALRIAFARLLERVSKAAYELEWADSGDTSWEQAEPHLRALLHPVSDVLSAALDIANSARDALEVAIRNAVEVKP